MKPIPKSETAIAAWLENPNTPADAWKTYTYKQIAAEVGMSETTVRQKLCKVLFEKKILADAESPLDYLEWRRVSAILSGSRGKRVPQDMWDEIEFARIHKKKTLMELSIEFGISYNTIQSHFQEAAIRIAGKWTPFTCVCFMLGFRCCAFTDPFRKFIRSCK